MSAVVAAAADAAADGVAADAAANVAVLPMPQTLRPSWNLRRMHDVIKVEFANVSA